MTMTSEQVHVAVTQAGTWVSSGERRYRCCGRADDL